jgi:hypothetical protein
MQLPTALGKHKLRVLGASLLTVARVEAYYGNGCRFRQLSASVMLEA